MSRIRTPINYELTRGHHLPVTYVENNSASVTDSIDPMLAAYIPVKAHVVVVVVVVVVTFFLSQ